MKKLLIQRFIVLIGIAALLGSSACSDDYFNPEPLTPNKDIQVSAYDFLSEEVGTFDMFVEIIDKTNYKDSINISGATVLAVNNDGVKSFLKFRNLNSIDEVELDELRTLMGKYVFRKSLTTTEINSTPEEQYSVTGYPLNFSKRKDKWKGTDGVGPLVIFVQDLKEPLSENDDVTYKVVTSDIKTSSGFVLAFGIDHIFGF